VADGELGSLTEAHKRVMMTLELAGIEAFVHVWSGLPTTSMLARSELPGRTHEALIRRSHEDRLVGHISRDATAIEVREKPVKTAAPGASTSAQPPKRKRGRPKKGEVVEKKESRRLERQAAMSLDEMLSDLPTHCAGRSQT
jgi:hypothetical protein